MLASNAFGTPKSKNRASSRCSVFACWWNIPKPLRQRFHLWLRTVPALIYIFIDPPIFKNYHFRHFTIYTFSQFYLIKRVEKSDTHCQWDLHFFIQRSPWRGEDFEKSLLHPRRTSVTVRVDGDGVFDTAAAVENIDTTVTHRHAPPAEARSVVQCDTACSSTWSRVPEAGVRRWRSTFVSGRSVSCPHPGTHKAL